jgi:hypothetical protein
MLRPRPLLDAIHIGSAGSPPHHHKLSDDPKGRAAGHAPSNNSSRAAYAAAGAAVGAAGAAWTMRHDDYGTFRESYTKEHKGRSLREGEIRLAFRAHQQSRILASAAAGGAMAYTYASDVNANNLATQRGQATIGGLTQIARVAAAGTAGALAGFVAPQVHPIVHTFRAKSREVAGMSAAGTERHAGSRMRHEFGDRRSYV